MDEPRPDGDSTARDTTGPEPAESDLHGLVEATTDATWGDTERSRVVVPGIISGEVGPKGRIAAQHRDLSRRSRSTYGEVPSGMNVPGTGRYVLLPILLVAGVLLAVVILFGWWLTR